MGSLTTVARELARYKLDLVGEQGGTVTVGDFTCYYGQGNMTFVHYRIVSTVASVEIVSNRMSYIVLKRC